MAHPQSALTGEYCSLAHLGMAHILSWLSCVAVGAAIWPSLAHPRTWPIQMLTSTATWPGLARLQPNNMLLSGSYGLARSSPNVPTMSRILFVPAGAVALLDMVCPLSYPLHVPAGAATWSSLDSLLPVPTPVLGLFLSGGSAWLYPSLTPAH